MTPSRVREGATPPNKVGILTHTHTTTHRTLMPPTNTHTLLTQGDREVAIMGDRATMTGTTVVQETMTTGTIVMERGGREEGTEEEEVE